MENSQSATLHFSNDTIIFDTAFHSIGTPTQTLTIYNRNNFTVLSDISLKLISGGSFRMNVDGVAGNNHNAIEIPAKDSIFIFLEVTPNQNSSNDFLLTSNIEFTTGTKKQDVKLVSPGRNANFHLPHDNIFTDGTDSINYKYFSISENTTWTNDLPHVIYGYVVIEPNATLTIEEGTKIYFHNNSGMFVGNPLLIGENGVPPTNNGTLIINGDIGNEVTMQGDRIDSWYENIPGQWNGIHFVLGSINSTIEYAIISNGTTAIHADSVANSNPTVTINNTIIENMSSIGILGQGANIAAANTVVSKCGQYTVACNIGGTYNFTHCTFANYWDYNRRSAPSILLNNYYEGVDGNTYPRGLEEANFTNCIIYGNLSTEVSFQENKDTSFNYNFNHCLIKLDPTIDTDNSHYENVIINQSPKFANDTESDFHLTEDSPAIDAGIGPSDIDIEGNPRNTPDLGAYEFQ
ncbi:hypothetical protein N9B89_00215 [Flavobacteriales bacterium]|nr:hypothetical protein [Flavobacteriales bacterium]